MKRLFAASLIVILLCGTAAAQTTALRVYGDYAVRDNYQATYPDRLVDSIPYSYENGQSNALEALLQHPDGWDVAIVDSTDVNLAALDDAGLLMDLSQEPDFAQRADALYETIRSAVLRNHKLLAIPLTITGAVQQMSIPYAAALKEHPMKDLLPLLELTETDRPGTFAELSDLAQRYMALSAETRRGTAFNADVLSGNPKAYYLRYMIELYTAQYSDAAGSVAYDTAVFRQAVADTGALADALISDRKLLYPQNGSNTIYNLVNDAGTMLLSNYGVPLYLGIGDNTAVPARLKMVIVNPGSSRLAQAIDFVRSAIQYYRAEGEVMLLENPDYETLASLAYDEIIAAQISQGEAQAVIDALNQERALGEYSHFYSRDAIEQYRKNIVQRLTFPKIPPLNTTEIANAYAAGKLDLEGLIAVLAGSAQNGGD